MRISDWSSDVCSSDLGFPPFRLFTSHSRTTNVLQKPHPVPLPRLPRPVRPRRPPRRVHAQARRRTGAVLARLRLAVRARCRGAEPPHRRRDLAHRRSEEHTSELQSLMRISYAVFCFKQNKTNLTPHTYISNTK